MIGLYFFHRSPHITISFVSSIWLIEIPQKNRKFTFTVGYDEK